MNPFSICSFAIIVVERFCKLPAACELVQHREVTLPVARLRANQLQTRRGQGRPSGSKGVQTATAASRRQN